MPNYQNGKIYKITAGNLTYIGSTCEPTLARRLAKHVASCKCWKNNKSHFITSFPLIETGQYEITLIELFPCGSKDELTARERFHIESNICVNKYIPTQTDKEYYQKNKEEILEKVKSYYETNKDAIAEKGKAYRDINKEAIAEKDKAYRDANKEAIAEKDKAYYKTNKDAMLEKMKVYREANKEAIAAKKKAWKIAKKASLSKSIQEHREAVPLPSEYPQPS